MRQSDIPVLQIPDLFAVAGVLALVLLLVAMLAEQSAGSAARGVPPALLEQPEDCGGWPHISQVGDSRPARPRAVWLVQPGEVVVDHVPAEVQAEALEILDTLRALDALFPDHCHRTGRDEGGS